MAMEEEPRRCRQRGTKRERESAREREGGRWWEGSDMADVTACVGEYSLCCQPGVSLMKIGIQVSCHSFSMSERGAGEHSSVFFSRSHYKRQDIIHTDRAEG